jgi:biotin carboxylase
MFSLIELFRNIEFKNIIMNKTILIFGGGLNQLELILESKKNDINTVVIDPCANSLGRKHADYFYRVDGNDYQKTLEIALKHKVNGIITGQMEKPLRIMAKLALELGYIFNSPEIIEKCLNKSLMKGAFKAQGIKCAKGVLLRKNEQLTFSKLKGFKFPLIVKPIDAFSSRGVMKANSFEELIEFEKESRTHTENDAILIEEYLLGREFSVECITFQKETVIIQITEKFITPYPNTVEIAHLQPARISENERIEIESLVKRAISSLEIDNSASHAEIMLTKNGPYIIEIGARLGGDFISSYLTKASTGISMDRAAVQVALGIKPDLIQKRSKYSMIKYVELMEGKEIKEILPINDLETIKGYVFAGIFAKVGDIIPRIRQSSDRLACVLFEGDDLNNLYTSIELAEKKIKSKFIFK